MEDSLTLNTDKILNILALCTTIQTLAEDQMNDDRDGRWTQRCESRMDVIIEKADMVMELITSES